MSQQGKEPLKIEFEPFYWNHFQSCLSRSLMSGCGVMFGVAAGGALVHTLMIERIPYSLRKYQLAPPLLLAGATAFLYTRYSINKCREEFFYLERKRAGEELPNASNEIMN